MPWSGRRLSEGGAARQLAGPEGIGEPSGLLAEVTPVRALDRGEDRSDPGRQPAPPLRDLATGIRSVFPPVESAHGRDLGAEAGRLAGVFRAASVSGRFDFP